MSIYTTPLQFVYFFALLFAVLLLWRGIKEERLSDRLLALVLFLMAMEIQDYTFGFSGINILWERFNGFPRSFSLAFAPAVYLYVQAQTNIQYKLQPKDSLHFLPYLLFFLVQLVVFVQGPVAVKNIQNTTLSTGFDWAYKIATWASYIYLFWSVKHIKYYENWASQNFSDTEKSSLAWISTFIYLVIAGQVFKWFWFIIDTWLDLDFYNDWWWHVLSMFVIIYTALKGYSQWQSKDFVFVEREKATLIDEISPKDAIMHESWKQPIEDLFKNEQIYLQPDLTLADCAKKLKTNVSVLSAAINQNFKKNFNDFVNEYRVNEFIKICKKAENKNYTLLALAFDSGFNSKATFNRAVKKVTGKLPKEFINTDD